MRRVFEPVIVRMPLVCDAGVGVLWKKVSGFSVANLVTPGRGGHELQRVVVPQLGAQKPVKLSR